MHMMKDFNVYETRNEYNNQQTDNTISIIRSENVLIHRSEMEILYCGVNENVEFVNIMQSAMEKFNKHIGYVKEMNHYSTHTDDVLINLQKAL